MQLKNTMSFIKRRKSDFGARNQKLGTSIMYKIIEIGKEIKLSLPIFFVYFVEKEKFVEKI